MSSSSIWLNLYSIPCYCCKVVLTVPSTAGLDATPNLCLFVLILIILFLISAWLPPSKLETSSVKKLTALKIQTVQISASTTVSSSCNSEDMFMFWWVSIISSPRLDSFEGVLIVVDYCMNFWNGNYITVLLNGVVDLI